MAVNKSTVTNAIDSAVAQIATAEAELKTFGDLSGSAAARALNPLEDLRRARERLSGARASVLNTSIDWTNP